MLPGVNGIKMYQNIAYVTNTDRAIVLTVKINPGEGAVLGDVEVITSKLVDDDLAVDVNGCLYINTHVHNSIIRLNPATGLREELAGEDEGFAGCTTDAFIGDVLYVTTTGVFLRKSSSACKVDCSKCWYCWCQCLNLHLVVKFVTSFEVK